MSTLEILQQFGLEVKEAKVYLAVLELSKGTVQGIARKAGLERTGTYYIVESLMKKGLLTLTTHTKKKYFLAENPQKLLTVIKEREQNLQEILPELQSLYNTLPQKPRIRFFEGEEGIKTIYKEIIYPQKEILCYASSSHIYQILPDFFPNFIQSLLAKKIKMREIVKKSAEAIDYGRYYKKPLQEMRFLSQKVDFATDNVIFEKGVAMISYRGDTHGIVIESPEIAQTQKEIFEILWNLSRSWK